MDYKFEIVISEKGFVNLFTINGNPLAGVQRLNMNLNLELNTVHATVLSDEVIQQCSQEMQKSLKETVDYLESIPFVEVSKLELE